MRISAGNLKGRKVSSVKALRFAKEGELRPTSSKVREAVFNILREKIRGAVFIDLYAGTGAVGFEAISRGAGKVFFVESDKKRVELIRKAAADCGCGSTADILKSTALDFVREATDEGLKGDVIFLDPPYHSTELDDVLSLLSDGELLGEEGIIIAEHFSRKKLPDEIGKLRKKKDYKYGDTVLTLFRKE
ncbi:MAG: 16S rRNA (guanine(966)-N(2))-methyltransferase RsmD [Nitrospirae bacterium]|nr:MAG: 16S rRNA (guanine(966)-N(2))-methyltransferase RsmD [Nitrospirota bacterium]